MSGSWKNYFQAAGLLAGWSLCCGIGAEPAAAQTANRPAANASTRPKQPTSMGRMSRVVRADEVDGEYIEPKNSSRQQTATRGGVDELGPGEYFVEPHRPSTGQGGPTNRMLSRRSVPAHSAEFAPGRFAPERLAPGEAAHRSARRVSARTSRSQKPAEEMIPDPSWAEEGETIVEEGEMHQGMPGPRRSMSGCWDDCDGCEDWIDEDCGDCGRCRRRLGCFDGCCDWCWSQDLSVTHGVTAFKSPVDLGINSNFGVTYGVNWGGPLWNRFGIGYQLGYRGVTSDFNGELITGLAGQDRQQHFFTAGVFRRLACDGCGWQWGVVGDWLDDSFYVQMNLGQVRAEVSHFYNQHEIGYWGSFQTNTDSAVFGGVTQTWGAMNLHSFFYRRYFQGGIESRLWAGFNGSGNGLFGSDMMVPLSDRLGFQAVANYVAPPTPNTAAGVVEESWGLAINMIWYPGRTGLDTPTSRWRPLFHVADNATFIVDRLAP